MCVRRFDAAWRFAVQQTDGDARRILYDILHREQRTADDALAQLDVVQAEDWRVRDGVKLGERALLRLNDAFASTDSSV